jgi:hypothetical protein
MSVMTAYLIVSWLCGVAVVVDAVRRPHAQWVAADRDRGWWVATIVACSIFGLGPMAAGTYLVAIVPGFSRAAGYDSGEFRK